VPGCGAVFLSVAAGDSKVTAIYARLDSSVTLLCTSATPGDERPKRSSATHVQWLDYVYNSDQHPLLIYSALDNPARLIHRQHPQRQVSLCYVKLCVCVMLWTVSK